MVFEGQTENAVPPVLGIPLAKLVVFLTNIKFAPVHVVPVACPKFTIISAKFSVPLGELN